MRVRAERVDQTRERIAEAAVRQHLSVGPSRTSIASIAEAAGVTRLTVYRHFADMDEVFTACMGHWLSRNPPPDAAAWVAIEDFDARAKRVLTDIYRWYGDVGYELYPVYRDIESVPPSSRVVIETFTDPFADVILGTDIPDSRAGPQLTAIARHLVRLLTWRSLVLEGGLSADEAASLGVRWLIDVRRQP
jgi:AcrR family transcriptional regulator